MKILNFIEIIFIIIIQTIVTLSYTEFVVLNTFELDFNILLIIANILTSVGKSLL
jgi:hypothetical protein